MRFTKHLAATSATLLAVGCLTACTPSPEPDEALVAMHQEALQDAQALTQSAPQASALREEHAGEIATEIQRLCGFTDEGELPESCTFDTPAVAAAPEDDADARITDSQTRILQQLDEIPTETVPLITEQYIEQARLGPVTEEFDMPGEITLDDEDLTVAQELLAGEYAAAWALGVALPHVSPELADATQTAIDRHRGYAALLRTTLDPFAETSPSEPGYDLSHLTQATDAATALAMVTEIQNHSLTDWHHATGTATDPGWRSLATQVAGAVARDTVPFA